MGNFYGLFCIIEKFSKISIFFLITSHFFLISLRIIAMASKLLSNEMWKGGSGGPPGFIAAPGVQMGWVGGCLPGGPGVNTAAGLREDDKRLGCEMFGSQHPGVKFDLWSVLSPSLQLESTKTKQRGVFLIDLTFNLNLPHLPFKVT